MEHGVRAEGVRRLVLKVHSGAVTLSDSGGTHVEGTIDTIREPRIDQHDSWLTIHSRQEADVRLAVPTGIDVEIRTRIGNVTTRVELGNVSVLAGSGDVRLARVTGPTEVSIASGDLDITDVDGAARVRSASGDITIGRVGRALDAKAGSGDITVASNRGDLFVKAGSGNVSVGVPEGTPTWLNLNSATGDVRVLLPETEPDEESDDHASIQVVTASGNIKIVPA
ncbi:DUF4097 family beta strand repeat-containing protein [Granulicoccus sp. GXG6511]|uniref:DUF4097 family beta strand repeat-containing protein n=1 Tax=Granulicoccus sp. GXG6511 TaxID=3381351 RepID=UPI003D7E304F